MLTPDFLGLTGLWIPVSEKVWEGKVSSVQMKRRRKQKKKVATVQMVRDLSTVQMVRGELSTVQMVRGSCQLSRW